MSRRNVIKVVDKNVQKKILTSFIMVGWQNTHLTRTFTKITALTKDLLNKHTYESCHLVYRCIRKIAGFLSSQTSFTIACVACHKLGNMQNSLLSLGEVPNVDEASRLLSVARQHRGDYHLHLT